MKTTPTPRRFIACSLVALVAALPLHAAAPATTGATAPATESAPSLEDALKKFAVATVPSAAGAEDREEAAPAALRPRSAAGLGAAMREWQTVQSQLGSLQRHFDNNDYGNALTEARNYARNAPTPELRERWHELVVAISAEQQRVEEAQLARIDQTLRRVGAAFLESSGPAAIDPLIDELHALQETNRHRSAPRSQRAFSRVSSSLSFLTTWQEILLAQAAGDPETARQQLRNLVGNLSSHRLVTRSQLLGLISRLGLEEASITEAMARIDPVVARAAETALAARNAEALDATLLELQELKDSFGNQYDSQLRRATERVNEAINFFNQWQGFLAAYEGGDLRDARQQLRNLASNSYRYRPISRTRILARSVALEGELGAEIDDILAGLDWKNLTEIRARVSLLQENAYGRQSTELSRVVTELDRLHAARTALDSGRAGLGRAALGVAPSAGGCSTSAIGAPLAPPLAKLREAWWFDAMPALTGLADLPARKGDETAAAYAARQLDAALAAGDWARAHRFALLQRDLLPPTVQPCGDREKVTGADAAAALGAFLLAEKLEQARQTEAAAAAYRQALAAGAPPALETLLLARLRALASAAAGAP